MFRDSIRIALLCLGLLTGLACQQPLAPSKLPLAPSEVVVPPNCSDSAPLQGQFDPRAPGYIVMLDGSVDAQLETARLAAAYGFVPTHVFEVSFRGFAAELTPTVVAGLRCEATVRQVEHDGLAGI